MALIVVVFSRPDNLNIKCLSYLLYSTDAHPRTHTHTHTPHTHTHTQTQVKKFSAFVNMKYNKANCCEPMCVCVPIDIPTAFVFVCAFEIFICVASGSFSLWGETSVSILDRLLWIKNSLQALLSYTLAPRCLIDERSIKTGLGVKPILRVQLFNQRVLKLSSSLKPHNTLAYLTLKRFYSHCSGPKDVQCCVCWCLADRFLINRHIGPT